MRSALSLISSSIGIAALLALVACGGDEKTKPKSPEPYERLARKISATLTKPLENAAVDQATRTHISAREARTAR